MHYFCICISIFTRFFPACLDDIKHFPDITIHAYGLHLWILRQYLAQFISNRPRNKLHISKIKYYVIVKYTT